MTQQQPIKILEKERLNRDITFYRAYVWGYAVRFAFYLFLAGGTGGMALFYGLGLWQGITLTPHEIAIAGLLFGLCMAGIGGAAMLHNRVAQFDQVARDYEYTEYDGGSPKPIDPTPKPATPRVIIPSSDGRVADFEQPRPGEFAAWLYDVLLTDSKTTLSQNTATQRGWPIPAYKNMLAQVYMMGWFAEGKNQVPEPTQRGIRELNSWLKNIPPTPNS